MMGEGKTDYGGSGSCAICYKVFFDDKIKEGDEILFDGIKLDPEKEYAVITQIEKKGKHYPPAFREFTAEVLGGKVFGGKECSKFVTEV